MDKYVQKYIDRLATEINENIKLELQIEELQNQIQELKTKNDNVDAAESIKEEENE